MFDNLRQKSAQEAGLAPAEEMSATERALGQPKRATGKARASGNFLGLTAFQRFVLALELFLIVSVLGCGLLLALEKIVLPF